MDQHDLGVLNTLIVTTIDSALGFEESAQAVASRGYEAQFRQFASERRQIVAELNAQVRRLGGTPQDEGSVKAAAHRRWVDFKSAITGASDTAVIAEVSRGESYIREKYELALKDEKLSPETRLVVEQAFGSVRAGQFFASRLHQALSSGSGGSLRHKDLGLKVLGAAGLAGVAYAAYRMFSPARPTHEPGSRTPGAAHQYSHGTEAETGSSTGQRVTQSRSNSRMEP